MSMTLSPDKKAQEAMKKAAVEAEREAQATQAAAEQAEGASDAEDENVEDGS
jgi:hypothetical protein